MSEAVSFWPETYNPGWAESNNGGDQQSDPSFPIDEEIARWGGDVAILDLLYTLLTYIEWWDKCSWCASPAPL